MASWRKSGEITVDSAIDDFHMAFRATPGFQGADIGYRWRGGVRTEEICLRLHVSARGPNRAADISGTIPATFAGLPVDVIEADYAAVPTSDHSGASSSNLTSGGHCAGSQGGGRIALMVVERETDRIGFLTSWAAAAGPDRRLGAPVFERCKPPDGEAPIGFLTAMKIDHYGSAAFVERARDRPWLPITRPGNQVISALRNATLGERLMAGSARVLVDGFGIYRVRHEVRRGHWKTIDIKGNRLTSKFDVATGSLLYDEVTSAGIGLVCASGAKVRGRTATIACMLPRVLAGLGLRTASFDDLIEVPFKPQPPTRAVSLDSVLGDPREYVAQSDAQVCSDALTAENARQDIATVIWPELRRALAASGHSVAGITGRVERLCAKGTAHEIIADVVNGSSELAVLGIEQVRARDLAGAVTFDQVCERLNDVAEARSLMRRSR